MPKEQACKFCKRIGEESICPICQNKDFSDTFKGKVEIVNPEKSELAKQLKINKKGVYAIRI